MHISLDMLTCMRTTLNLPDALVDAAKQRARDEGRTLTSLVEEGLRAVLRDHADDAPTAPLPTYGHPGGRVLVDLDDQDAVWAKLDTDGTR